MTHDIVKTKVEGFYLDYIAILQKPKEVLSKKELEKHRKNRSSYTVFHKKAFLKVKRVREWKNRIWTTEYPSYDKTNKDDPNQIEFNDEDMFSDTENDSTERSSSSSEYSYESISSEAETLLTEQERKDVCSLGIPDVEIELTIKWDLDNRDNPTQKTDISSPLIFNVSTRAIGQLSFEVGHTNKEAVLFLRRAIKNTLGQIRLGFKSNTELNEFLEKMDLEREKDNITLYALDCWEEPDPISFRNRRNLEKGRLNMMANSEQS